MADHGDHAAQQAHRGQWACNPAEAARDVVGTLHEFGRPAFTGYCDLAADGTHALELDGDRREIPPWGRWPLRAACLAYEHDEDGRPALRGWLLEAIKNDAYSRGPKFDEDYRIRFSSGLAEPTSAGYAQHSKEPQRYFRTLTR